MSVFFSFMLFQTLAGLSFPDEIEDVVLCFHITLRFQHFLRIFGAVVFKVSTEYAKCWVGDAGVLVEAHDTLSYHGGGHGSRDAIVPLVRCRWERGVEKVVAFLMVGRFPSVSSSQCNSRCE